MISQTFVNAFGYRWNIAYLLGNGLIVVAFIFLIVNLVVPALKSYARAKKLDQLFGTLEKHWFYGDMKHTSHPNRLLHICNQTKVFPILINRWVGPILSEIAVYHPSSVISVLASGAPKNDMLRRFFKPWIGDGLLVSSGKKWQRNRKLLTPAFHYTILRPYAKIFNHSVMVMIEKWKSKVGNPVEISEDVSLMTLDSMLQCAMSSKTDCQNVNGKHPYVKAIYDMSNLMVRRFRSPFYLIDWIFYRSEDGKKFKKAADLVHEHAEKIIEERRNALNDAKKDDFSINDQSEQHFTKRKDNLLDFLDILLQTKDEDGVGLSDREIRDEVDTFLFEGHDTTASGISWTLHNLAKYPEFQERCRKEVNEVVRDKTDVEWDDLSKLSYLTMFLKESMRLNPPVPIISRQLDQPLQFSHTSFPEKVAPSKSLTSVHIFAAHRHEEVWESATVFDPERFTKENISKRPSHAYVPFSAGSRNCIGQNFAMNEMKIVLAQVLRNFILYLDEETVEPELEWCLVLKSPIGIQLKFKPIN